MSLRTFSAVALLVTISATGCNMFSDLEAKHPYSESEGGCTCGSGEVCVDDQCIAEDDPCGACTDSQRCVDDECVDSTETCDEAPDEPRCQPNNQRTCEDDPAQPDCLDTKTCPDGMEIPIDEDCPCADGSDECDCVVVEDGNCIVCPGDVVDCECSSADHCSADQMCSEDGFCVDASNNTSGCDATDPNDACMCDVGDGCGDDMDCDENQGICRPYECDQENVCYYVCGDDVTECPDGLACTADGRCRAEGCECPDGADCDPETQRCSPTNGELIMCDTDEACGPGYCLQNICYGG